MEPLCNPAVNQARYLWVQLIVTSGALERAKLTESLSEGLFGLWAVRYARKGLDGPQWRSERLSGVSGAVCRITEAGLLHLSYWGSNCANRYKLCHHLASYLSRCNVSTILIYYSNLD